MVTVSPDPQFGERTQNWLSHAYLDEPGVRTLNAFICSLAATRELHEALRLVGEEVRGLLGARFVAVVVFEDERQAWLPPAGDVAACAIPLRLGSSTIGQINVYFERPRTLDHNEVKMMEVVAAIAAVTLDNAQRLQREHKRLAQAETINTLAPSLAASRDIDYLARRVVAALRDLLHYDAARILWRDGSHYVKSLAQSDAFANDNDQGWEDCGLATRALAEDIALLIGDTDVDGYGFHTRCALRSLLAVPVRGSRGVLGVVEVGARSPRAFDNADLATLSSLAAQVAAVSERLLAQSRDFASAGRDVVHDLLSTVVHDLRGPLSLVKGYASTLSRLGDSLDGDKRTRFLAGIGEAADRINVMVDHLIGVSHIESGQFRANFVEADLSQLVTETVDRLRPQLGERPISIELPGKTLAVCVDQEGVRRTIGALLLAVTRNSVYGRRIAIRVRKDSLEVSTDAGVAHDCSSISRLGSVAGSDSNKRELGIVEIRDEIQLNNGSRAAATADQRTGLGNGLELLVAKKVVEAHGGHLWTEHGIVSGNCVVFSLPLCDSD